MLIEILLISGASIASIFTAKKILKRNNKKTFHVKYAFGNRPTQTYTDLFSITTSDRECLENQLVNMSKLKFIKDVRKEGECPSGICIHEDTSFISVADNKETFYISVL